MVPDPMKGDLLEECPAEERPMEEVVEEKNETMEEPVNRVKNNKEYFSEALKDDEHPWDEERRDSMRKAYSLIEEEGEDSDEC
jgi:hypothetical protein